MSHLLEKTLNPKPGTTIGGQMTGLTSEKPSRGCFYYLVSLDCVDKERRYVHSIERAKDTRSAPRIRFCARLLAKRFDSLAVCRSYCDFLNRTEGLQEFVVVME